MVQPRTTMTASSWAAWTRGSIPGGAADSASPPARWVAPNWVARCLGGGDIGQDHLELLIQRGGLGGGERVAHGVLVLLGEQLREERKRTARIEEKNEALEDEIKHLREKLSAVQDKCMDVLERENERASKARMAGNF